MCIDASVKKCQVSSTAGGHKKEVTFVVLFKPPRRREDPSKRRTIREYKLLSNIFILFGILFFHYPWAAFHQFTIQIFIILIKSYNKY